MFLLDISTNFLIDVRFKRHNLASTGRKFESKYDVYNMYSLAEERFTSDSEGVQCICATKLVDW